MLKGFADTSEVAWALGTAQLLVQLCTCANIATLFPALFYNTPNMSYASHQIIKQNLRHTFVCALITSSLVEQFILKRAKCLPDIGLLS